MSKKKKELTPHQAMQKKTFTGWANGYLLENMLEIDDLETAFQDGLLFIQFCETISNKKIGKRNWQPKNNMQKLENIGIALDFLKSEGLKFVNLDAKVIFDGKVDLILGMMWTIILRYQVDLGDTSESPKTKLLKWMSEVTGEDIKNFKCFPDGVVLGKLVNHLNRLKYGEDVADMIPDVESTRGDKEKGLPANQKSMAFAEDEFGIRQIIDAPALSEEKPEELSIMTYISYYMAKDQELRRRKLAMRELSPNHSYAQGPGLVKASPTIPATFTIYAVNGDGTPRPAGGDNFEVEVVTEKHAKVPTTVKDNGDGTYNAEYTCQVAGKLMVMVKCFDTVFEKMTNIQDSPFSVECKEGVDLANTRVHGAGVEKGDTCSPAVFQIDAISTTGKPMTKGGVPFAVLCTGPVGEVPVELVDNKNGTYTCTYNPDSVGNHVVSVKLEEEEVGRGPFNVDIVEGTDASKCTVEGRGIEGGDNMTPATFRITAFDKQGVQKSVGGDPFVVAVKQDVPGKSYQRDIAHEAVDNGDGTYDYTYQPKDAGTYHVEITLKKKPVANAPYTVNIIAGTHPEHCCVIGGGFVLTTRSKSGLDKTEGGDDIVVTVNKQAVDVVDAGNGTYSVDYKVGGSSATSIAVAINGETPDWSPLLHAF